MFITPGLFLPSYHSSIKLVAEEKKSQTKDRSSLVLSIPLSFSPIHSLKRILYFKRPFFLIFFNKPFFLSSEDNLRSYLFSHFFSTFSYNKHNHLHHSLLNPAYFISFMLFIPLTLLSYSKNKFFYPTRHHILSYALLSFSGYFFTRPGFFKIPLLLLVSYLTHNSFLLLFLFYQRSFILLSTNFFLMNPKFTANDFLKPSLILLHCRCSSRYLTLLLFSFYLTTSYYNFFLCSVSLLFVTHNFLFHQVMVFQFL